MGASGKAIGKQYLDSVRDYLTRSCPDVGQHGTAKSAGIVKSHEQQDRVLHPLKDGRQGFSYVQNGSKRRDDQGDR